MYMLQDFNSSYSSFNNTGAKYTQVNAVNVQHILDIYKNYLKWLFKEIQYVAKWCKNTIFFF